MNIGFDFDGIFIDAPPLVPRIVIEKLYRKKTNGRLLYRIPSKFEQKIRLLAHHPFLRPPITENIAFLKELTENNSHKHYLISSRFSFLRQKTEELTKKYGIDKLFNNMYFNYVDKQPHIFKNQIIKQIGIHRYVDDDIYLLNFLSLKNPKTIFFWLNKNKKGKLKKNLFAISHLSQMFAS